jgi:hypothetical protein
MSFVLACEVVAWFWLPSHNVYLRLGGFGSCILDLESCKRVLAYEWIVVGGLCEYYGSFVLILWCGRYLPPRVTLTRIEYFGKQEETLKH